MAVHHAPLTAWTSVWMVLTIYFAQAGVGISPTRRITVRVWIWMHTWQVSNLYELVLYIKYVGNVRNTLIYFDEAEYETGRMSYKYFC